MQNLFEVSTTFVFNENPDETVSIEFVDKANGLYEMSNGETLVHSQLISSYTPLVLMTQPLSEKSINGSAGTVDGKLKGEIERRKENFGLDLVADASMFNIEEQQEQHTTTFDFNKTVDEATFIYEKPSESLYESAQKTETYDPKYRQNNTFDGDVLYESFKRMNTGDGNLIDVGEVFLKIPSINQIKQFKSLFDVGDDVVQKYIKHLLSEPETIELVSEGIAELLISKSNL